jgi:hypothetical protein
MRLHWTPVLGFVLMSAFIGSAAAADTVTFDCDYKTYSDPEGTHKVEKQFRLTFLIDSKAKKSYLIGNNGSSEVQLVVNADGFTLVEVTDSGNVMVTAISANGKSVHSRNGIMLGDIIPSQYYGTCMKK